MSIHLTPDQETELAGIAQHTARTTDDVAQEAVAWFLESRAEHSRAIARAREQVRLGQTIPHDEVFVRLKQRMGW
jgi:predicted transcriptional regulator